MKSTMAGVILAAGLSRRMGQPKMLLPWGQTTVLGQVISTFFLAGLQDILVVTGGASSQVEAEIIRLSKKFSLRFVYNPSFESGEMLSSLQFGLQSMHDQVEFALIGLGDQPQLSLQAVECVLSAGMTSNKGLVVPSFNMRRGHPWLVRRDRWGQILALKPPQTLRDFINANSDQISYVDTDSTILKDLDTPDEYLRDKP